MSSASSLILAIVIGIIVIGVVMYLMNNNNNASVYPIQYQYPVQYQYQVGNPYWYNLRDNNVGNTLRDMRWRDGRGWREGMCGGAPQIENMCGGARLA